MRAIALLSLVLALLLTGVPCAAAQNKKSENVTAVLLGGPDVGRRAPDFSLPWATKSGISPIEAPYQLASDGARSSSWHSIPGTLPTDAPLKCEPLPNSMTVCL